VTAGELFVRGEQLAQAHEGAHDVDRYFDSASAVQDRSGHDGAVLGEGEWKELAVLAAAGL